MNNKKVIALVAIFSMVFSVLNYAKPVNAATLSNLKDTVSTMKASTAANHLISFTTPTGVAAGQTISVTFDAGYTMGSVAFGDIDVTDNGTDLVLAAAPAGATWGATVAGQVLTITSGTGTIVAGHTVTIEIGTNATFGVAGTNRITNGAAGNNKTISLAGTFGDTGVLATAWLSDDVVTVDGTVNPTLSFALSANAVHFGTLSSTAVRYADTTTGQAAETVGHTMTASTNATNGYTITYAGTTLTSGANTITAAAGVNVGGTPGSEQFAVAYNRASGTGSTGTVAAGYTHAAAGYTFVGGSAQTFFTNAGAADTEVLNAYYMANISSVTEAGVYSTALTYTATGNF